MLLSREVFAQSAAVLLPSPYCGTECEPVGDYDFSAYTNCSNAENPFEQHCVPCWRCSHGSPQMGDSAGNKYALIWSRSNGLGEGIHNNLFNGLQRGIDNVMYLFQMRYKRDRPNNANDDSRPFTLHAMLTTYNAAVAASPHAFQCDDNGGGAAPTPAAAAVFPLATAQSTAQGYDWTTFQTCIYSRDIPMSGLRILYIYPSTTFAADTWVDVDDIRITKINPDLGPAERCICKDSARLTPVNCLPSGIPVTYTWYKDGVVLQGQTGPYLTVTSPQAATTYSLSISSNGYSVGDQIVVLPGNCPPPALQIQDRPVQICASSETKTFHTEPAAVSYQWYKNNVLQPGDTNSTFTVHKDPGHNMTVSVDATDEFGCTVHDSLTFHWRPQPEISINANDTCDANNMLAVTLTITNYDPFYDPYKVTFKSSVNATVISFRVSGQPTGPYTATFRVPPDQYDVYVDNGAGTDNQCTGVAQVIAGFYAVAGVTKVDECRSGRGGNMEVNITPPGNYIYSWQPGGDTTAAITDRPFGTYTVTVTDRHACHSTKTLQLDNNLRVVTSSRYAACVGPNHGAAIVSVTGGAQIYSYIWNTGDSVVNVTASTSSVTPVPSGTYSVTIISGTCSEVYSIEVADSNCCITPPRPPYVTQIGNTLYCVSDSLYASYQWYDLFTIIPGATDTFLIITHPGNYNVMVSNADSCKIATGITVEILSAGAFADGEILQFKIRPNPVSDELTVSGELPGNGEVHIYDVIGQTIFSAILNRKPEYFQPVQSQHGDYTISCKSFVAGIYFIEVSAGGRRWMGKFVKE